MRVHFHSRNVTEHCLLHVNHHEGHAGEQRTASRSHNSLMSHFSGSTPHDGTGILKNPSSRLQKSASCRIFTAAFCRDIKWTNFHLGPRVHPELPEYQSCDYQNNYTSKESVCSDLGRHIYGRVVHPCTPCHSPAYPQSPNQAGLCDVYRARSTHSCRPSIQRKYKDICKSPWRSIREEAR